jgi:hypothetical protein
VVSSASAAKAPSVMHPGSGTLATAAAAAAQSAAKPAVAPGTAPAPGSTAS